MIILFWCFRQLKGVMVSKKRTRTYRIFFYCLKKETKAKDGDPDNDLITKDISKFLKKIKSILAQVLQTAK
jgi:hypothetical protein